MARSILKVPNDLYSGHFRYCLPVTTAAVRAGIRPRFLPISYMYHLLPTRSPPPTFTGISVAPIGRRNNHRPFRLRQLVARIFFLRSTPMTQLATTTVSQSTTHPHHTGVGLDLRPRRRHGPAAEARAAVDGGDPFFSSRLCHFRGHGWVCCPPLAAIASARYCVG